MSRDERERETFIRFVAFSHTHPSQPTKATQTLFLLTIFSFKRLQIEFPPSERMKKIIKGSLLKTLKVF